jgi:hypothetical protein
VWRVVPGALALVGSVTLLDATANAAPEEVPSAVGRVTNAPPSTVGTVASPGGGSYVEDSATMPLLRARVTAGFGVDLFVQTVFAGVAYAQVGSGFSLEEAIGVAPGLEVGARFGVRTDDNGRALRADEPARGLDTETFGTGLSTVANPELRLKWRAFGWEAGASQVETGLAARVVLPIEPDPDLTGVLGAWASIRAWRRLRVDIATNLVVSRESFDSAAVIEPGLSVPLQLWVQLTRALFAGVLTSTRTFGGTAFTSAYTEVTAGVAMGLRVRSCDIVFITERIDAFSALFQKTGFGLSVSCAL